MNSDGEKLLRLLAYAAKDYERRLWMRIALIVALLILLTAALIWIADDADAKTIEIRNPITPVNLVDAGGKWIASASAYTAEIVVEGTATIEQSGVISQFFDELFFGRNEAGVITWKSLDSPKSVIPEVRNGNEIWWTGRWTRIDYCLKFTEEKIEKFIYLSAPARDILPSPTSTEYFPGALEEHLIFGLGSRYMQDLGGAVLQMDGVEIDIESDQAIGNVVRVEKDGKFLYKIDSPQFDAALPQHLGYQCFLGDYDRLINCFPWMQAKNARWFDPTYILEAATYLVDGYLHDAYNYYPGDNTYGISVGFDGATDEQWGVYDIDLPALAANYGISATSDGVSLITAFSLKLIGHSYSAGSPTDIYVKYDPTPVADTTTLTWATRDTAPLPICTWAAAGIGEGVTQTINDAAFLQKVQACIVANMHLQIYFIPSWSPSASKRAVVYPEEASDVHNRPIIEMTIYGVPADLVYPGEFFHLASPKIGAASLTVSASLTKTLYPLPAEIALSASGWMEDISNAVQIANYTNAVSSADAYISGASPLYSWYIMPVTYSNLRVMVVNSAAPIIYYASNLLDVWTPYSAVHKGSTAQVLASTYSLMGGGWIKYYAYDGDDKVQCGTSATTLHTEPNYGIVDVILPSAQQDNSIHLGVENHMLASVSRTIFALDYSGGGGTSDFSADRLVINEHIAAGTAAVLAGISANEVLIGDVSSSIYDLAALNRAQDRFIKWVPSSFSGRRVTGATAVLLAVGYSGLNSSATFEAVVKRGNEAGPSYGPAVFAYNAQEYPEMGGIDYATAAETIFGVSRAVHYLRAAITPAMATGPYQMIVTNKDPDNDDIYPYLTAAVNYEPDVDFDQASIEAKVDEGVNKVLDQLMGIANQKYLKVASAVSSASRNKDVPGEYGNANDLSFPYGVPVFVKALVQDATDAVWRTNIVAIDYHELLNEPAIIYSVTEYSTLEDAVNGFGYAGQVTLIGE
ncbi:MAG: hypothetical protein AB1656_05165 [Candidatus Omnitrophota bacterium]